MPATPLPVQREHVGPDMCLEVFAHDVRLEKIVIGNGTPVTDGQGPVFHGVIQGAPDAVRVRFQVGV
jgi:hypothetical protein